ncbi:MAG TPA: CehA/McbA family metallohydrolase [Nannocystaceae bacterium]|nr:CehA/McbA family metallohydrolase [Nannocystaceae bacterium]
MRHVAILLLCACDVPPPPPSAAPRTPAVFLKGQLHLHSNQSGDSDTPPDEVARWYAAHGYDFIVFTDHNRMTDGPDVGDMLVLPGMEITMNVDDCVPPPEGSLCPLHVNALVLDPAAAMPVLPEPPDRRRDTLYRHGLALAHALGGVAQLNHPNFHYALDAELIVALAQDGALLLEIANNAIDSNNEGDATHPSTEAIWDDVLRRGVKVWGTATDDAHHYDDAEAVRARGELAFEGERGWVMVRADREPAAIRDALARGDFYATSGALLDDVQCTAEGLRVIPRDTNAAIACIPDGRARAAARGPITCRHGDAYVRARIVDSSQRVAWTQPCFASRN